MLLDAVRNWLHPKAKPDPKLDEALSRVDAASEELRQTVEEAKRRGVFAALQEAVSQAAAEDEKRIRRTRRYMH